jgi:hypothetical protein
METGEDRKLKHEPIIRNCIRIHRLREDNKGSGLRMAAMNSSPTPRQSSYTFHSIITTTPSPVNAMSETPDKPEVSHMSLGSLREQSN